MALEYIRICPVCETHNPLDRPLCACGAALAGVDFTLKPEAVTEAVCDATVHTLATANSVTCPHADCAQPNPAGRERCLYCNRPLRSPASVQAFLRWPWGESTPLPEHLLVGREPPAPEALLARLEREYSNVSRRHAEFEFRDGELTVTDLASLNGTFVDGVALAPRQAHRLAHGQRVRFGADLTVEISIVPGENANE